MSPLCHNPHARLFGAAEKMLTLAALVLLGPVVTVIGQGTPSPPVALPVDSAAAAAAAAEEPGTSPLSPVSPNSFAQEALKKLYSERKKLAEDVTEAAVVEERTPEALPAGVRGGTHETALKDLMSAIFLQKGKSWFTQTVRDTHPVPYELKDLQLAGPTRLLVTEADKANGIDQRISYGFSVSSHRKYAKASGWLAWEKGKPVLLTGIIMSRVKGIWVIDSSPRESFSLK